VLCDVLTRTTERPFIAATSSERSGSSSCAVERPGREREREREKPSYLVADNTAQYVNRKAVLEVSCSETLRIVYRPQQIMDERRTDQSNKSEQLRVKTVCCCFLSVIFYKQYITLLWVEDSIFHSFQNLIKLASCGGKRFEKFNGFRSSVPMSTVDPEVLQNSALPKPVYLRTCPQTTRRLFPRPFVTSTQTRRHTHTHTRAILT
jgi:hypothetical protein